MYAANPRMAAPDARPSSPSVKFTAFEKAAMMNTAHTTHANLPRSRPNESQRVNDTVVCTLVAVTIKMPNPPATPSNPNSLARLLSPRLRSRMTLIQSSSNPTSALPMIAAITKIPVRV
ncbi:unannotated protein [freshwater metagenome]|uniref:Unannotated protein n=1 Tax=freshwater metagenome TaxID=449393 RepID=A0A6J6ZWP1_9ZZZZ